MQVLDDLPGVGLLAGLLELDRLLHLGLELDVRIDRRRALVSFMSIGGLRFSATRDRHPLRVEAFLEELEVPLAGRSGPSIFHSPLSLVLASMTCGSPALTARTMTACAGLP